MTNAWEHRPVVAMGLTFAGPLGVAPGVDRDGGQIGALDLDGFGHIEIGTVTPQTRIAIGARPRNLRVGINFGSERQGLNESVIADYCAALRGAYSHADYLCANLSSPRGGRDGNSPGASALIARVLEERDKFAAASGRCKPLLVKLAASHGDDRLPIALVEARGQKLDGLVLACSDLGVIARTRELIADLTLISVGGVTTAADVASRLAAGATLVQTYSAFVNGAVQALRDCGAMPSPLTGH
ncbi:dihydroorotate oxidase [Rhodoblastus sp.]|uniref:dihydroorotate oxidase n=1 Tax=Rhodoblastus sp. TaxID=1962975 RepID=UPI0035B2D730